MLPVVQRGGVHIVGHLLARHPLGYGSDSPVDKDDVRGHTLVLQLLGCLNALPCACTWQAMTGMQGRPGIMTCPAMEASGTPPDAKPWANALGGLGVGLQISLQVIVLQNMLCSSQTRASCFTCVDVAHMLSRRAPTWDSEKDPFLRNVHLSVLHQQVLCAPDESICT